MYTYHMYRYNLNLHTFLVHTLHIYALKKLMVVGVVYLACHTRSQNNNHNNYVIHRYVAREYKSNKLVLWLAEISRNVNVHMSSI